MNDVWQFGKWPQRWACALFGHRRPSPIGKAGKFRSPFCSFCGKVLQAKRVKR